MMVPTHGVGDHQPVLDDNRSLSCGGGDMRFRPASRRRRAKRLRSLDIPRCYVVLGNREMTVPTVETVVKLLIPEF